MGGRIGIGEAAKSLLIRRIKKVRLHFLSFERGCGMRSRTNFYLSFSLPSFFFLAPLAFLISAELIKVFARVSMTCRVRVPPSSPPVALQFGHFRGCFWGRPSLAASQVTSMRALGTQPYSKSSRFAVYPRAERERASDPLVVSAGAVPPRSFATPSLSLRSAEKSSLFPFSPSIRSKTLTAKGTFPPSLSLPLSDVR